MKAFLLMESNQYWISQSSIIRAYTKWHFHTFCMRDSNEWLLSFNAFLRTFEHSEKNVQTIIRFRICFRIVKKYIIPFNCWEPSAQSLTVAINITISSLLSVVFCHHKRWLWNCIVSAAIFVNFYGKGSIEWRWRFYHYCAHSKILQNVSNYRSIQILF